MKLTVALSRAFQKAVIGVVAIVQSLLAGAAVTDDINGIWILDIPATEQAIYAAPPYALAKGFAMVSAYAGLLRFKVDGDTVTTGGDLVSFKLASTQNGRFQFSPNKVEGTPNKTLVIYQQADKSLRIFYTDNPNMQHMVWTRVESKPSQTTEDRIQQWLSALERIEKFLSAPQPIIPPDAAR